MIAAPLVEAESVPETSGSVEESMFPFAVWVRGLFTPGLTFLVAD